MHNIGKSGEEVTPIFLSFIFILIIIVGSFSLVVWYVNSKFSSENYGAVYHVISIGMFRNAINAMPGNAIISYGDAEPKFNYSFKADFTTVGTDWKNVASYPFYLNKNFPSPAQDLPTSGINLSKTHLGITAKFEREMPIICTKAKHVMNKVSIFSPDSNIISAIPQISFRNIEIRIGSNENAQEGLNIAIEEDKANIKRISVEYKESYGNMACILAGILSRRFSGVEEANSFQGNVPGLKIKIGSSYMVGAGRAMGVALNEFLSEIS